MMKIINLLSDESLENKKVLEKLVGFYLGITKEQIFMNLDREISNEDIIKIKDSYNEYAINKKPLEYIFGFVEFFGIKFNVTSDTLIPRPETEYMIQSINDFLEKSEKKYFLMDIGTGCGVLGLSTIIFNKAKIEYAIFTDITTQALDVAKSNYRNLAVDFNANFLLTDLFKFDKEILENLVKKDILLVANLPYIPDGMFENNVEDNVKKREPRFAFVGGEDGLALYRRMFDQIIDFRKSYEAGFTMFLEMLDSQAEILMDEYYEYFKFEKVATFHFNIKILKVVF